MHEIAKHEFLSWVDSLEVKDLNEYEITLLSIMINNFEEIASVGVASGLRAKLLSKKIKEQHNSTVKSLPTYKNESGAGNELIRIERLVVEKFRGFDSFQEFFFKKQYTFFHGPNGSGKTSFCEALEYCILGTIEEATACNIPLEKFIVHAGEKKGNPPHLYCKYSSGEEECHPNYSRYRFGFVEKNRIDSFSHISAVSQKTQSERIAALFGLSEFQDYVKGFTSPDGFADDKYIKLSSTEKNAYDQALKNTENNKTRIDGINLELQNEKRKLSKLIQDIKEPSIKTIDDAIAFFSEPEKGIIAKLNEEARQNKKTILSKNELKDLLTNTETLHDSFLEIQKNNADILSDVGAINLEKLYNTIMQLDKSQYACCPVCQTPLDRVELNPFDHAKSELDKLDKIKQAKRDVDLHARKIIDNYEAVFMNVVRLEPTNILEGIDCNLFKNHALQLEDVKALTPEVTGIVNELKNITEKLGELDFEKETEKYNLLAQTHNKKYDEKLSSAQKSYSAIIAQKTTVENTKKRYLIELKAYEDEKKKLEELKTKADNEKLEIDFNSKMTEAYKKIYDMLTKHIAVLPVSMARNLADKAKEYYNFINDGDADFELISKLELPTSTNEKILIEMADGVNQDALQFLSEGHLKILGLSILLAKAVQEKIPFLVFDDMVNAIDDDHRDGVSRLLVTHSDFKDMQMILTCHGEVFVTTLANYINKPGLIDHHVFLSADVLGERGVCTRYLDVTIPLSAARRKFEEGANKDCAMNCRRALECLTGKIWKKISVYIDGGISVKMRTLQGHPDLHSITQALSEYTKAKYIVGATEINTDLNDILQMPMWNLLNKGTHYDESVPEFSRTEIKKLLEYLEKLSADTESLKVKAVNTASLTSSESNK